jgi:hypothetical protein
VQSFELRDPRRREEVDARRHHLPELDEGRPELLEREAHALRRVELLRLGRLAPVQDLPGALEHPGDADAAHELPQPVADQYRGDLLQARQLPHEA